MKPPAVVRVRDAADVRAVVRWADRYDVPLVSRSGGHGYNGNSTSANAVVVDVGGLDFVRYADGIATVGPGARLGSRLRGAGAPRRHGPGRLVPDGGDRRARARRRDGAGRARDGADARPRDELRRRHRRRPPPARRRTTTTCSGRCAAAAAASASSPRSACARGASTAASFFRIDYPRGAREEALADWDALAPRAPRELTAILTLTASGASAFGQYLGSESALRRLIAPLGGTPSTGSADYLTVQRRWAGAGSGRATFAASSLYVEDRLSARGRRAFLAAADTGAGLILDAYGGAINRPSRSATAFPHRDARFSVQILSYTSIPVARSRVRRARALIDGHGNGAYANYADPDLDVRDYYGANLPRLRRIKREVDPANRFRPKQGIR